MVRMTRYVTFAYGDAPGVYRQSLMLLLSIVAHAPSPYELVVATDRPECYVWFGTRVEIEYLDRAVLDGWRGPDPFSMRQKLALLRAACPDEGAIALIDADVVARGDLARFAARLHDGELFMHKREYVLSRSSRPGNRRLWRELRARGRMLEAHGITLTDDDAMWNSGVIALPARDRGLIDKALQLYDAIGAAGLRHFAAEQLVEGLVFSRTKRLHAAEEWFTHYWGNKPGYDLEIARRLADAFIEGLSVKEAATRFREQPIGLPVEVRPGKQDVGQKRAAAAPSPEAPGRVALDLGRDLGDRARHAHQPREDRQEAGRDRG